MEIKAGQAEAFLRGAAKAKDGPRLVLLFGNDDGLVAERGKALAATICADLSDPFRVVDIGGDALKQDAARLADEFQSMSLMGGRRVVRVRPAGEESLAAVEALLEAGAGDTLVVMEAGNLARTSGLRRAVEGADNAAAIGCYMDNDAAVGGLVDQVLLQFGLRAAPEARDYLVDSLGGDRALSRAELEKLALYKGVPKEGAPPDARIVSLEEATLSVGDSAAIGLDDVTYAAFDGDQGGLDRALDRVFGDGMAPVAVVRAAQRHADMLHLLTGQGRDVESAMVRLRQPPHFMRRRRLARQARAWPTDRLARALELVLKAELDCKTTGMPDEAIARRLCLSLAQVGRGLQRQRA